MSHTDEQWDAMVKHNLTLRAQLDRTVSELHRSRAASRVQRGVIEALVSLLSQVGWRVGANGNATRLLLDTKPVRSEREGYAFVTISAVNTGRRWNVHTVRGQEHAVAQETFWHPYDPGEDKS